MFVSRNLSRRPVAALAFLAFFLCPFALTLAQSGWDFVKNNDFVQARTAFEAELKKNPQSETALVGLVFIAETLHDYENYRRHANQLMATDWDANLFWLFGHMADGPAEQLLAHKWPENIRAQLVAAQADTLFTLRKFKDSHALNLTVFHDWNWSVAGPFTNVAGSGFVEKTPVETEPFDPKRTFKNEDGVEFSWFDRTLREPGSRVDFEPLPGSGGLATYYANTFLTVPTARRAQIRLARHEPMKIWLDDQLIFENFRQVGDRLDTEIITFDLPAGTHRLLVKLAEFPDEDTKSKVSLAFNEVYDDTDRSGFHRGRGGYGNAGSTYRRYSRTNFRLRLTDVEGRIFNDVTSSFSGKYTPATQAWKADLKADEHLNFFVKKAESSTPAAWYLLSKAFSRAEAYERGEEYFVRLHERMPRSAFVKFLLAKFYDANDKGEKAEGLLSEMDTVRTPTFAEHFSRFEKIDKEQNEAGYVAMMEHILALSPTNWGILNQYLEHLKEKGKKEQVKDYVKKFMDAHRDEKWRERLEDYLKDESYKPESYKPETDKEREKDFKEAQKRLKKRFSLPDYNTLIEFYKNKEKVADALRVYDEVIGIMPWNTYRMVEKAEYLFEVERTDEALTLLNNLLKLRPYDDDVYETIGDIYIEKKDEQEALKWYRKAEKLAANGYGGGKLTEKIEKLENKKKYTGYFAGINLTEAAKDMSWREKYRDEESVISLFAQQVTYIRDEKRLESVRKMVIHIQNEAGAKAWTEGDFRQIGRITSAKILKKDGSVSSPDMDYNFAVFKNLQPGDIILIEGGSEQTMPDEIPGELLNIDVLTWTAPVAKATMEMLLPKDQEIYLTSNRLDLVPTRRDTGDFKMLTWTWRDIQKHESEEASPQNLDEYAYLMMGSVPDWSRVVAWYNRKTYCRTAPNYEVLDKARELIKPGMTKEQIVETLHTFITKDINYSYVSFLNSNYTPKKPGATLGGKVGDCKDVATLMISLLRENGIPAWYTLAETHGFSRQEPRPTLYVFNHAIVAYEITPGELRFADLTTDYYPNGIVPEFDSDAWGLVIREGETQIRRLPNHALDPTRSRVEITAKAEVDADENITLDVLAVNHGCPAGRWREELIPATAEDRRKKLSEYYGGGVLTHLDFERIEFENLPDQNDPLRARVRMKAFNQLDKVSNFWIMPLPLPLSTPVQKSLFAAKRYNDLDVDKLFELAPVRETVELALPAGFTLLEMPQNQRIESKFGNYALTFEPMPGGIRIRREAAFKQRYISHSDFQEFKKFYLKMLDADDAKLALKKK